MSYVDGGELYQPNALSDKHIAWQCSAASI